jgi:hypothetical protein
MSYDPTCAQMSDQLSCQRQYELAKMIADDQSTRLRYCVQNPSCTRFTQLADRRMEHALMLGRKGLYINNDSVRVTPQVSILDYPNYICETPKSSQK